jgi:probable rRNA maturation factor
MTVIVNVTDQQSALKISFAQVQHVVCHVLAEENQSCDEVNIHFVDTPTISQLHQEFFNDPSPTDCITFPVDNQDDLNLLYRILGEVFVCPATAVEYAAKHHKDPFEETTLYIVHGLLHLLGYDDLNREDRKQMKQAEARHMRKLKKLCLQLTS